MTDHDSEQRFAEYIYKWNHMTQSTQ